MFELNPYLGLIMQKNKQVNDEFLSSLGDSLRQRRIELLLSQEQLGILAKVHRSYVTEVENGLRNISMTTFLRISRALKSDPSTHILAAERAIKESSSGKDKHKDFAR